MNTEMAFITLTIAVAILLLVGVSFVQRRSTTGKPGIAKVALLLSAWLVYITTLSIKGVFNTPAFPPRVPLLLVFPAFAFIAFFFASGRFKSFIAATPAAWPVYFQGFRVLVELLLHTLANNGRIPVEATFKGYNFDIIIGITAPIIAGLTYSKHLPKAILTLWNYLGLTTLAIVVFIFISHAYGPGIWHKQASIISQGFGLFPYTYLAGFLMPCAIFMHVYSLVRIKQDQ